VFQHACKTGLEGIVSKRLGSAPLFFSLSRATAGELLSQSGERPDV
jgi:hypothetical protein